MSPLVSHIPEDVRLNQTYAHRFARLLVRPLLGTWVRPNHLTSLRILTGLGSCALLAVGDTRSDLWSGLLWIITCVLDRADGELARLGNLRSESGKLLDFYSDLTLDSLWFLACGIGARHGSLGVTAVILGVVTCVAIFACIWISELFERWSGPGVKAYYGLERFHPDDALFLLPAFVWFGFQSWMLAAASIVTTVLAVVVLLRCLRLRTGQVSPS